MRTSPNKPRAANDRQAAAKDPQRFIERHRPLLLRYLDGTAPASAAEPDALRYIDDVLNEWHERFREADLREPDPEERTFWYALYQLEELAERPGPNLDPYETLMMENLAVVRELLRQGRPLPADRFMATRPDGT